MNRRNSSFLRGISRNTAAAVAETTKQSLQSQRLRPSRMEAATRRTEYLAGGGVGSDTMDESGGGNPTTAECAAATASRWGSASCPGLGFDPADHSDVDDESSCASTHSSSGGSSSDSFATANAVCRARGAARRTFGRRVSFSDSYHVREFTLGEPEIEMKRRASLECKTSKRKYYVAKYREERRGRVGIVGRRSSCPLLGLGDDDDEEEEEGGGYDDEEESILKRAVDEAESAFAAAASESESGAVSSRSRPVAEETAEADGGGDGRKQQRRFDASAAHAAVADDEPLLLLTDDDETAEGQDDADSDPVEDVFMELFINKTPPAPAPPSSRTETSTGNDSEKRMRRGGASKRHSIEMETPAEHFSYERLVRERTSEPRRHSAETHSAETGAPVAQYFRERLHVEQKRHTHTAATCAAAPQTHVPKQRRHLQDQEPPPPPPPSPSPSDAFRSMFLVARSSSAPAGSLAAKMHESWPPQSSEQRRPSGGRSASTLIPPHRDSSSCSRRAAIARRAVRSAAADDDDCAAAVRGSSPPSARHRTKTRERRRRRSAVDDVADMEEAAAGNYEHSRFSPQTLPVEEAEEDVLERQREVEMELERDYWGDRGKERMPERRRGGGKSGQRGSSPPLPVADSQVFVVVDDDTVREGHDIDRPLLAGARRRSDQW